jgi:hypothetical protein
MELGKEIKSYGCEFLDEPGAGENNLELVIASYILVPESFG